jgi:hypothetical protein
VDEIRRQLGHEVTDDNQLTNLAVVQPPPAPSQSSSDSEPGWIGFVVVSSVLAIFGFVGFMLIRSIIKEGIDWGGSGSSGSSSSSSVSSGSSSFGGGSSSGGGASGSW